MVFIQCKILVEAFKDTEKNFINRTKKNRLQGLLYMADLHLNSKDNSYKLVSRGQELVWIGIIVGNYGTNNVYSEKFVHLLYLTRNNFLIAADSVINNKMFVFIYPNPSSDALNSHQFKVG